MELLGRLDRLEACEVTWQGDSEAQPSLDRRSPMANLEDYMTLERTMVHIPKLGG